MKVQVLQIRLIISSILLFNSGLSISQEIDTVLLKNIAFQFEQEKSIVLDYQYGFINCFGISDDQKRNWTVLNTVLRYLEDNESVDIAIISHANCTGNEDYNKELTKIKSQEMKNWFLRKGVSTMRIKSIGMGMKEPITMCSKENKTDIECEKNDRIEIRKIRVDKL